jgi:hypothetical protein
LFSDFANNSVCPGKFILARLKASLEIGEVIPAHQLYLISINSSALLIE